MSKYLFDKYPPERNDWLMKVYYADKKLKYHCILCEKTHHIKDCPNKLTEIPVDKKYKSMYDHNEDEQNPQNYGR